MGGAQRYADLRSHHQLTYLFVQSIKCETGQLYRCSLKSQMRRSAGHVLRHPHGTSRLMQCWRTLRIKNVTFLPALEACAASALATSVLPVPAWWSRRRCNSTKLPFTIDMVFGSEG